jgi:hypothetical protein
LCFIDPTEKVDTFKVNHARGGTVCFGNSVTEHFLQRNRLGLLVRSHEVQDEGFKLHHNNRCITVFSAPNYCGVEKNKGAVLKFDGKTEELLGSIVQFNAYKISS